MPADEPFLPAPHHVAAKHVVPASDTRPDSVEDIVVRLDALCDRHSRVTVDEMADAFGARSYGPFLIIPALLEITRCAMGR